MTTMLKTSRRGFLAGSAAAAGGFMLGFHIPFSAAEAAPPVTGGAAPELNAWVVVKPDETVIIRVARVEMGQGTLPVLPSSSPGNMTADGPGSRPNSQPRAQTLRAIAS